MKFRLRDHLSFTDRERNGTIVLLVLVALMSVFFFLEEKFIHLPKRDFAAFDQFLASLEKKEKHDSLAENNQKEQNGIPPVAEEAGEHSVFHQKTLFDFNPNGLPEDDWVRLGLSPSQAHAIKNYEAKGGKFVTKEDVKKMFVISAERYAELEPFIVLPEKKDLPATQNTETHYAKKETRIVELNTADSSDLVSVNGIGPFFAKRILSYRERLGGFHSTAQLKEVFGMDDEHFAQVSGFVKADSSYIRRINVNTATVADLKKHPYIAPGVAQALVNYRKQHGPFRTVADIRGCALITEELYRKLAPYLIC